MVRFKSTTAALALLVMLAASPAIAQSAGPGPGYGPPEVQQRFERMDQMMRDMRTTHSKRERRHMSREHRRMMHDQMAALDGMPRPGPSADPAERLKFMEQRMEIMRGMVRQLIERQELEDDDD